MINNFQNSHLMQASASPIVGVDLDKLGKEASQSVLIVEDEPETVFLLKQILLHAGFNVSGSYDGKDALKKAAEIRPDLLILDLMMPEMDGWEFYQHLRKFTDTPVIIVSAIADKEKIVRALKMGADDYITKPFFNAEVAERARAVLRRAQKRALPKDKLYFPDVDLSINFDIEEVIYRQKRVQLTGKEFAVLAVLAKRAPVVVPYRTITLEIWGEDNPNIQKRIKYLVFSLRRKFEMAVPGSELIATVGRLGYKLQTE